MDILYNKDAENHPKIFEEDIQYYGMQLLALVENYRKYLYVKNDEQENALRELEYYARMILSKNYDMLMTNSKEVIVREDPLKDSYPI